MITLRKESLVYRWFLFVIGWFSESDKYIHREQTNLCFFLRALIIKTPLLIFMAAVLGPLILVILGLEEAFNWLKRSLRRKPEAVVSELKLRQPSKVRVIYDTLHGKICPTVTFE